MSKRRILFFLIVVLASIALVSQLSAIEPVLEALSQINPYMLGLALIIQLITIGLLALQWQEVLKWTGYRGSWLAMLRMNMKGSFMDFITPGAKVGGEVARIYLLKPHADSYSNATVVVGLQKFVSIFVFLLFTAISLYGTWPQIGVVHGELLPLLIGFFGLFGVLLITILAIVGNTRLGNFIAKFIPKKFARKLEDIKLQVQIMIDQIRTQKGLGIRNFILAAVIWILYPVKLVILAAETGIEINFWAISAITFITYMVSMIPISPGSIGTFEGTMTGLLVLYGVSWQSGLTLAIIFRFVTFWAPLLLTSLFILGDYLYQRRDLVQLHKIKKWIPNTITFTNLALGTTAIFLALTKDSNNIKLACVFVLLAVVTDMFDGFLARKLDVVSEFGMQLDSLCDLVSFGVAPMIIGWQLELHHSMYLGILLGFIYVAASVFRLARYNCCCDQYFIGMPITLAGAILIIYYIFSTDFDLTFILMMILAICMVHPVKIPRISEIVRSRMSG